MGLNAFVKVLVEKFQPMQIYSFCEIVKTDIHSGCFTPQADNNGYHCFLLMVMESPTRNEHEAQDFCRSKFEGGKITILSHSLETITESIKKNNRFFISILNEGKLVYNHTGILVAECNASFDPSQNHEKAKKHYEHRLKLAKGFLHSAEESHLEGHSEVAVFLMHQIVEQSTIALLRVNLAYRSDIHHLGRQLDLCCCFSSEPSDIFRSTKEDLRLFEILLRSYSQARYNENFIVDYYDAEKLLGKVKDFLSLTERICIEKITGFEKDCKQAKEREVCFE